MKFVPEVPIDNAQAGGKPLCEPMVPMIIDAYMRHSASMS